MVGEQNVLWSVDLTQLLDFRTVVYDETTGAVRWEGIWGTHVRATIATRGGQVLLQGLSGAVVLMQTRGSATVETQTSDDQAGIEQWLAAWRERQPPTIWFPR